jgi:hypothetical protein
MTQINLDITEWDVIYTKPAFEVIKQPIMWSIKDPQRKYENVAGLRQKLFSENMNIHNDIQ